MISGLLRGSWITEVLIRHDLLLRLGRTEFQDLCQALLSGYGSLWISAYGSGRGSSVSAESRCVASRLHANGPSISDA